eukprot:3197571-Amphidinium_carterae.1
MGAPRKRSFSSPEVAFLSQALQGFLESATSLPPSSLQLRGSTNQCERALKAELLPWDDTAQKRSKDLARDTIHDLQGGPGNRPQFVCGQNGGRLGHSTSREARGCLCA